MFNDINFLLNGPRFDSRCERGAPPPDHNSRSRKKYTRENNLASRVREDRKKKEAKDEKERERMREREKQKRETKEAPNICTIVKEHNQTRLFFSLSFFSLSSRL